MFLLVIGLMGVRDYFRLKGPPLAELHQLKLTNVTKVVAEPEISGSDRIDSIWLQSSDNVKIRYRNRFPYSSEIRRRNPNYSLWLDQTNLIWAVSAGGGELLARSYFDEYNIEAKSVGKFCGTFLAIMGAMLLFVFIAGEAGSRAGKPPPMNPIPLPRLVLIGGILGYLSFFSFVIIPLLHGKVPGWLLSLLWVLGAGLIGNGIVAYFRKHPPNKRV